MRTKIDKRAAKIIGAVAMLLVELDEDGYQKDEVAECLFGSAIGMMLKERGPAFTVTILTRTAQTLVANADGEHPFEQAPLN